MAKITEEFLGSAGLLQIQNGVALDSTLRVVTDQSNITSTLYLSRNQVKIGSVSNDTPLALFGNKNIAAIFNTIQLTGTDKTFTFPDVSMTFAGINIAQTFTAAQTFNSPSASGTDGSPIRILTDPWTTGNGNQNHPLLLFGPHGGNIWAASPNGGTYIGINAVAFFPGNFLDFHVNNGASVFSVSSTGAITTTAPGAASKTALSLTGAWFTGGTTTTTKPQFLIEPTGTSSTNWSVNGTGLGINAASGFTGNLLDLQVGGVSRFRVSNTGTLSSLFVSGTGYFAAGVATTIGTAYGIQSNLNIVPPAGTASFRPYEILYTINAQGPQTGGATATGIFLNATETALFGMAHNLMDLQTTISGVTTSRFKVDNTGTATISNINLGPSAGVGGVLNLGNGGNGSAINAAGLQMYNFSLRHRFDGDGIGSAFVGNVYIGANSATSNTRLQVSGVLGQNIVRFDDNTGTSKFILTNTGVATYNATAGTAGTIFDVQIDGISRLSVTGSNGVIGGTTIGTTNSSITNFYENGFVKTWAVIASTTAKVTFGSAWNNINLPTSRPSIVGDFYVDTAANILANGDKLVAIRQ